MSEITIALIIFLFPLAYSPGPGNMFFATNGARFGFAATVPSNIDYHIATWLVTVVIGLGMITALNDYPNVFLALKMSVAAYVLWLAWKLIRAGRYDGRGEAKPATFWDGVILLILNPKAYIIMALMFSQFLSMDGSCKLRMFWQFRLYSRLTIWLRFRFRPL
jgi:threonine/homoserine/homoserine lactone efflux protein